MGIGFSVIALETSHKIKIPFWIYKLCEYSIIAGTVATPLSALTVEGGYKKPVKKEGAS
jgi:hypothetical protein